CSFQIIFLTKVELFKGLQDLSVEQVSKLYQIAFLKRNKLRFVLLEIAYAHARAEDKLGLISGVIDNIHAEVFSGDYNHVANCICIKFAFEQLQAMNLSLEEDIQFSIRISMIQAQSGAPINHKDALHYIELLKKTCMKDEQNVHKLASFL